MSPKSQGRRKSGQKASKPRGRPGSPAQRSLTGLFRDLLRDLPALPPTAEPLDAELMVSALVGTWWGQLPPGEDPDRIFGEELITYAGGQSSATALALVRVLEVLGTPRQRELAAAAAAALAGRGVAEPPWARTVGRVRVGECWRMADIFGDQASVVATFGYGEQPHAVVTLVDHNLGGMAKDVFVTDKVDAVLRQLRKDAGGNPLAVLEQIDPGEAAALLNSAFAMTDMTWQPPVSKEFGEYRALALSRIRALSVSAADGAEPAPVEISQDDRDALVSEFLASGEARKLPDRDAAASCARLIVDYGCDYDDGQPLRVSPAKTEIFLLGWLPRKAILRAGDRAAVPAVTAAWVRWAAARAGLPGEAVVELTEAADELGKLFDEAYDDPAKAGPARLLLEGVGDVSDPDQLREAIERQLAVVDRPGHETAPGDRSTYQIKVSLRGTKPPVWRRLRVPGRLTLARLHEVLQVAMGWEESHLHAFEVGSRRYADPGFGLEETSDEGKVRLAKVAPRTGRRLRYFYDFGDGWEHDILVEKILPASGDPEPPRCLTGRRACPPEDCGGTWGYGELCEAIGDPRHERHVELLEWVGGSFDPAVFDREAINRDLHKLHAAALD
ncbi:MAG: plasmid pRiA4b ORF-3 family protein [Streptomycetales bacterium]